MSISDVRIPLGAHEWARMWTADSQDCFHCAKPIGDLGIIWQGATACIALHPACVHRLTTRLLRDTHEYECKMHKELVYVDRGWTDE